MQRQVGGIAALRASARRNVCTGVLGTSGDPDEPAPGQREISFDEFKSVWNENAYGNNIRAMIVTRPRSGAAIVS